MIKRILLVVLIASLMSCKKTEHSVQYKANCGNCVITYHDRDGNVIYVRDNYGNWEYNFAGIPGRYIYVSVTSLPDNTGFIGSASVSINVGNKEFRTSKTTSTFHTATASGYLED